MKGITKIADPTKLNTVRNLTPKTGYYVSSFWHV